MFNYKKREYNNKLKILNYKNLAKKLFVKKFNINNYLKNLKIFIYYKIIIKN